jgi:hypothetical protein
MTFRTSGRGRGDSAFGVSGFRVSRISGTLDLCLTPALALVSNFVRDAEWQNWSSQPRPTWPVAHTRAVKAGSNAVLLVRSFCAGTRAASLFEILGPGNGYRSPNRGPGKPILSTPALRRSSGLKAGRPARCPGSFGPNRDHRCCQERVIRRAAAKGGQGGIRRLQAAEAALKD